MDLSATGIARRGPITQEEKDRRRRLGLCFYCGERGHLASSCGGRASGQTVAQMNWKDLWSSLESRPKSSS